MASGASRPVEMSGEASSTVTRVDSSDLVADMSKYGIENLRNSDLVELGVQIKGKSEFLEIISSTQ